MEGTHGASMGLYKCIDRVRASTLRWRDSPSDLQMKMESILWPLSVPRRLKWIYYHLLLTLDKPRLPSSFTKYK